MQRPDEAKREAIMKAAVELFATRPFHEVRLDEIAEAAAVGKGTLYIYFKSKEQLYGSLVLEGFTQVVEQIKQHTQSAEGSAWQTLEQIVREFVSWAKRSPSFLELMRYAQQHEDIAGLREKRRELGKLIEATISRGVREGELVDPRPELTAQFIPSCVRGALRHGPEVGQEALANHILRILAGGILRKQD